MNSEPPIGSALRSHSILPPPLQEGGCALGLRDRRGRAVERRALQPSPLPALYDDVDIGFAEQPTKKLPLSGREPRARTQRVSETSTCATQPPRQGWAPDSTFRRTDRAGAESVGLAVVDGRTARAVYFLFSFPALRLSAAFLAAVVFVGAMCSGWVLRDTFAPDDPRPYARYGAFGAALGTIWPPFAGRVPDRAEKAQRSAARRRAAIRRRELDLGTRKVAGQLLGGRVDARWVDAAGLGPGDKTPETLLWPVDKGWFVRGYGSGEGGYHLAMDIMGMPGWPVRAAGPGLVAYAGNEVRGYGNLILIVHPGGWVTLYAHNSVHHVVAGERVERGAVIAEVGNTGISRGPHVHFELIHDHRNCDPAPLFRPGVRHRNGMHAAIAPVAWERADERPAAVRCDPRREHPHSRWHRDDEPIASIDR